MTLRESRIDADVLELIEHLFRRGTRGLLGVPPWQLGEVLLGGHRGSRLGSRSNAAAFGTGRGAAGRAVLVRAALVELAWALRAIANLRLAAAPRSRALLLLERGAVITPAALAERLAARFGDGALVRTFLPSRLDPRHPPGPMDSIEPAAVMDSLDPSRPRRASQSRGAEARRTQLLAEFALELAPSDAGRITLALAERGAGRKGSALELLRDVLSSEPDACDAACAWLDVAAHHAAAGRLAAAGRAAERSRTLFAGASPAPVVHVTRTSPSAPVAHRFAESVPV